MFWQPFFFNILPDIKRIEANKGICPQCCNFNKTETLV